MRTDLFDYELPPELIAQRPSERRGASRMLVLDRRTGECELHPFADVGQFLTPGDALICNDTKVMNARMYARKDGREDGALFELLLLNPLPAGEPAPGVRWQAMMRPGKRALPGVRGVLLPREGECNPGSEGFTVAARLEDGTFAVDFDSADQDLLQRRYGHVPLPPYIKRGDEGSDFERYQTIFALHKGAVAAPTAGLHFTTEIWDQLKRQGVRTGSVTLHVGAGTFKPVSEAEITDHKMHRECYVLPQSTADLVNAARRAGKKVVAIGTTTVRTLESCAAPDGTVTAQSGSTEIFLYPPYQPRAVDVLLTNFHLPKSTLLMLVSCFVEREKLLNAYRFAIANRMRFYSYGDCMLLK